MVIVLRWKNCSLTVYEEARESGCDGAVIGMPIPLTRTLPIKDHMVMWGDTGVCKKMVPLAAFRHKVLAQILLE